MFIVRSLILAFEVLKTTELFRFIRKRVMVFYNEGFGFILINTCIHTNSRHFEITHDDHFGTSLLQNRTESQNESPSDIFSGIFSLWLYKRYSM